MRFVFPFQISKELFFYLIVSKNYSFIYTGLFENLKARFLKSIFTWSEMGQPTVQDKEVYWCFLSGTNLVKKAFNLF